MARGRLAVLVAGLLLASCTSLFFQPDHVRVATPDQLGLAYEEVRFKTRDGLELYGWFLPAQGSASGTILQLHGNAENISTHFASLAWMPARGFNVFIFDYRGYGGSEGRPTLEGAQMDIDAALRTLLSRRDVDGSRIAIYGQSLGGALAAYYAAHSPCRDHLRAVILESAFSDYTDIVQEKLSDHWFTWPFQWVAGLTVDDRFAPLPSMPRISPLPVLILQGDRDTIVPMQHAQRLYDAALAPRQLWIVHGAGHIQTMRNTAERDRLVSYLREVFDASAPAPSAVGPAGTPCRSD